MKKPGLIRGIALIAIGVFFIYWAQTHSPQTLGKVISNELSGSYTLSEPWYYITLGIGIIVGIVGLLRTYKSMK
jgi:hypothetical protein